MNTKACIDKQCRSIKRSSCTRIHTHTHTHSHVSSSGVQRWLAAVLCVQRQRRAAVFEFVCWVGGCFLGGGRRLGLRGPQDCDCDSQWSNVCSGFSSMNTSFCA
ncbi:hypothetical protein ILYODFUR_010043 [Ilyodon furcidens]|uniref:Uncharacterized protein n=1 Tax=Ilyodon furcidens TaxID=33524 RepID=A0ABV0UTE2_9TELE